MILEGSRAFSAVRVASRLGSADSLGCYLTWRPGPTTTDADRKCISNVRPAGLPPTEAGATIAGVCRQILERRSSGIDLVL